MEFIYDWNIRFIIISMKHSNKVVLGLVLLITIACADGQPLVMPTYQLDQPEFHPLPYAYIEGCLTYSSLLGCQSCQYNYVLKGNKCEYKPISNAQDCCGSFSADGKCTNCVKGLIPDSKGQCKDIKIPGCTQKGQDGCIACGAGYDLTAGRCAKNIPGCIQYGNGDKTNNYACTKCDGLSQLVAGSCVLNPPALPPIANCLISFDYGCAQCQKSYRLDSNLNCVPQTIKGCAEYYEDGTCKICKSMYYILSNGVCQVVGSLNWNSNNALQCRTQLGFIARNDRCQIDNCLYFDGEGCKVCAAGKRPSRGGCIDKPFKTAICTACRSDEYLSSSGVCVKKDVNCISYQNGQCTACSDQFYLAIGKICTPKLPGCIYTGGACTGCVLSFTFDQSGFCSIPGCLMYKNDGCQQCLDAYTLTSSLTCQIPNCLKIQNNKCVQCLSGYAFDLNGKCVVADVNCLVKNSFNQCLKCADGYQIGSNGICTKITYGCNYVDGRCVSCRAPFTFVPLTQTCIIDGCVDYFVGGCKTCAANYGLVYNNCKLPNCLVSKEGKCLQCDPDYIFRSDGTCVNKDEFCDKYDSQGKCIQCLPNFYMSVKQQKCVKRAPGCNYDCNDVCISCDSPFRWTQNRCIIDGCLTLGWTNCIQCQYPFISTVDKLCTLPHCTVMKEGVCYACQNGYVKNAKGLCAKMDPNCLTYDQANTQCKRCIKGYKFDTNGLCQFGDEHCWDFNEEGYCTNCDRIYFLNQYYRCQLRDMNCITYANGFCVECKKYYFAGKGVCLPNLKGCQLQKDYNTCLKCDDGYTLQYGKCNVAITRLTWNSVDMDFFADDNSKDQQTSLDTFTIGVTSKLNLCPAIQNSVGIVFWSTSTLAHCQVQVDSPGNDGWSPQSQGFEFIGVKVNGMETFYALDIKSLIGSSMTSFRLEYSQNGFSYTKIGQFLIDSTATGIVKTFYFTAVYAKSIRLVPLKGLPNIKIQFYYSNKNSLATTDTPNNNTFIQTTVVQTIDAMGNEPIHKCGIDAKICWMGMEACEPKNVSGFSLSYDQNSKVAGEVLQFNVDYTVDGIKFVCWKDCKSVQVVNDGYTFDKPIFASKLHVHFSKYRGVPSFGIKFIYC